MSDEGIPVLTLWQPHCSLCVIINPETGLPWKGIETRSWAPPESLIGQRIALHAAAKRMAGIVVGEWKTFYDPEDGDFLMEHWGTAESFLLPLGAIVATCTLVDVVRITEEPNDDDQWITWHRLIDQGEGPVPWGRVKTFHWERGTERSHVAIDNSQRFYGDFTVGGPKQRYAWLLADVVPVDPPVPFRGGQRLTRRWVA